MAISCVDFINRLTEGEYWLTNGKCVFLGNCNMLPPVVTVPPSTAGPATSAGPASCVVRPAGVLPPAADAHDWVASRAAAAATATRPAPQTAHTQVLEAVAAAFAESAVAKASALEGAST